MGKIGEKLDIDFVISTGDNFYDNGLEGVNDPAFEESFSKIYTAKSLQKQWYSGKSPLRLIRISLSQRKMLKDTINFTTKCIQTYVAMNVIDITSKHNILMS